jgi:hypothetical protein
MTFYRPLYLLGLKLARSDELTVSGCCQEINQARIIDVPKEIRLPTDILVEMVSA